MSIQGESIWRYLRSAIFIYLLCMILRICDANRQAHLALPVRTRLRGEKAPQGDLCDDFYLVWAGRAFTGSPLGPSYLRPQPVITATASTTNRNQQCRLAPARLTGLTSCTKE